MSGAADIRKFLLSQSIAGTKRAQFGDQIFDGGQSFDTGGAQLNHGRAYLKELSG
jgi:hypothetical protein